MTLQRFRSLAGFSALSLILALPAAAQSIPEVNYPIQHDVSPPVRTLIGNPVIGGVEVRAPLGVPLKGTAPQSDPVTQSAAPTPAAASAGANFEGVAVGAPGCNCAPPDTEMAVGPTSIVQWVNTDWAVFDKSGVMQPGYPKAGNSFWQGFSGDCATHNNGDPIIQYDRVADRWVATQFALNTPFGQNYQCIAVSVTNDPGGSYNRYQYAEPFMPDYPKAAVWPVNFGSGAPQGAYFFSFNMFQYGQFFQGPRACAYDRPAMLSGAASPAEVCFQRSPSEGSILATDFDGDASVLPPANTPNFYWDFGTNALLEYKFTPNFATPSSSSFTGPVSIPVAGFSAACGGGTCVPQAGTTQQLDTLADRLMYRNAYRNFGDHDAVVINHSVTGTSSNVGVRWYEIRDPNGASTVYQQSTYSPDSTYRWMGSIAFDKAGNIGVGYSASSSAIKPAIRFTGRETADPLNTLQAESTMYQGAGAQTGGLSRWGDYSAMRIDPADDCTFWYTNEYIPSDGSFNWHTRIGSFKFNSCGTPPPPPPANTPVLVATDSPTNPGGEIDLTWTYVDDGETSFKIERCAGAGCTNFAQIAQVPSTARSYNDTGVSCNVTYDYRVRASNSGGDGPNSNVSEASTVGTAPSPAPSLSTTAVAANEIDLSWTPSVGESGYDIYRCAGAGCTPATKIASVGPTATTYNDVGLTSQTSYTYKVTAASSCGNTDSNTSTATTPKLAAPTGLTATAGGKGNSRFVDLSWIDNSSSETNFDVYRCTGNPCSFGTTPLASVGANVTTYRDNSAARRTTYSYIVKARDGGGSSDPSNTATATTN